MPEEGRFPLAPSLPRHLGRLVRDRRLWALAGVWALAFLIRAISQAHLATQPGAGLLIGDAGAYDTWGSRIAGGNWLGDAVFYQAPLYPYFLGTVYAAFGHDLQVLRLIQAAIGATSCLLLGLAGSRFFSPLAGSICGVLLALYPLAIYFDGAVQKPVLDLFLGCWLLAALSRTLRTPTRGLWLLIGLILGLLVLTRENALVLIAPIFLWLILSAQQRLQGRRAAQTVFFVAGLSLVLLPVSLRNRVVGGEFHLTTSQFGSNLYIGNNPEADGTYHPLREGRGHVKFERSDAVELAEQALGRKLRPSEVSRYWLGRSLAYVREQPGHWLKLMAGKIFLIGNALELGDTESLYSLRDWSRVHAVLGPVWHFGVLLPLAMVGICATWGRRKELWILHAVLIVYAGSVALFYVFDRYRFPLVPPLILFAAAGLADAPAFLRRARPVQLAGCALIVAAGAICSNWPASSIWPLRTVANERAKGHNNVAAELSGMSGRNEQAIASCRKALEVQPGFVPAHILLGVLLQIQGQPEEGLRHLREAVGLAPDYHVARFRLGMALLAAGQVDEGISQLTLAETIQPRSADIQAGLGKAWGLKGDYERATRHLVRALEIDPRHEDAFLARAWLSSLTGRVDEELEHLNQVLGVNPANAWVHSRIGKILGRLGNAEEAARHYHTAIDLAQSTGKEQLANTIRREFELSRR